jgi:hypothetical protein
MQMSPCNGACRVINIALAFNEKIYFSEPRMRYWQCNPKLDTGVYRRLIIFIFQPLPLFPHAQVKKSAQEGGPGVEGESRGS